MDAQRTEMMTRDGVRVTRTATPFDPAELGRIAALVDQRRGGVMSSGMEYPGRYSRWHMAYADPCAEIVATGRQVTARALNDRGRVLLPVLRAALRRAGAEDAVLKSGEPVDEDTVVIVADDREFTEEERSRRPTVFTALREITAALGCEDPHLGLYGAFGYDLAFQFEPVRLRLDRPATQRDLVLHLPDEIWVLDRQREEAVRYSYDFEVGGVSTAGFGRQTASTGPGQEPSFVRDQELPAAPQPGSYARVVEQARERFACGDLFEVVPGHVFYGRCASPAAFYELLRQRNPAPYEFLFNLGEGEYLVGASPEMYVRVTGDRVDAAPQVTQSFPVSHFSTTTKVSMSPTTVTYGHESASVFTATVTGRSNLTVPNNEHVTVHVGSVGCTVVLKTGKGTCKIANAALPAGSYSVSAIYSGDAKLEGSNGSSSSKLTVKPDKTTIKLLLSKTTVTYGNESASVLTASVTTHNGETVPNGERVTVIMGSAKCTLVLNRGRQTCKIANTALPVGSYSVSAVYGGDANLTGSKTSSAFKLTVS